MPHRGTLDPKCTTMTRYVLQEQRKHPEATGDLTQLLISIQCAVKAISSAVRKAGITHLYGLAGAENVQGESVKILDVLANDLFINMIRSSYTSCLLVSEENEEAIIIPPDERGKYIVCMDPLDGSSNIDCLVTIGSIFGIWKTFDSVHVTDKLALNRGCELVAAGYAMYGSATVMVLCVGTGSGVHSFTLDPEVGEFLLTERDMSIPERGNIYSINEGYSYLWDGAVTEYIGKKKNPKEGIPYSARYVGSMVADVHRTLKYGGIFLYPATRNLPRGKLRVLYESLPMGFLVEEAGGLASTGLDPLLQIEPVDIHQRTPVVLGSRYDVEEYLEIAKKHTRSGNFYELAKYFIDKYRKDRGFAIEPLMPVLQIETLSRHVMMNRTKLLTPGLGLTELLSSLDSAFRQVSEFMKGITIPKYPKQDDVDYTINPIDKIRGKVENIILNMLMTTNCAYYIVSSARKEVISIKRLRQGDFILAFDPIDGLENETYLLPMGTTFGVYRPNQEHENYKDLLFTCGEDALVVAGYIVYGACTELVITFCPKQQVLEFTYDSVMGEFILTNDDLKLPYYGSVCCVDNSNKNSWLNNSLIKFVSNTRCTSTNLGSFVTNFHLMMRHGGVIIDPPTEIFPNGQFQILTKLNPLAFICKAGGGKSYGGDLITNLLDICTESLDETAPCIMGSMNQMEYWEKNGTTSVPKKRRSKTLSSKKNSTIRFR